MQVPSRVEPVLADKEVLLTALNIKALSFDDDSDDEDDDERRKRDANNSVLGDLMNKPVTNGGGKDANGQDPSSAGHKGGIPIIVDLAFASNVRFLDDHELHVDNVELYKTLPFAAGQALARGILDSLMSTTYFNASALRLIRYVLLKQNIFYMT